jgi:hypothetical protein
MKTPFILLFCLLFMNIFAQETAEKEIATEVSEVTVFISGAQVTRRKNVDIPRGTTVLKFSNLSPFIDSKSVQVKANGEIMVLSVNHQQNFLDELEKPSEVKALEAKIKETDDLIHLERTHLSILEEEIAFLKDNRVIGGKNNELSLSNLKETSEFYSNRLTSLMLKKIERHKTLTDLSVHKNNLINQLNTLSGKKKFPMGELLVKVESKTATQAMIELSYLVENAGWHPSYDIRAKSVNDPVEIIYKANVRQDTKIDWNNVRLRFSSSNPTTAGTTPQLQSWYLDYNSLPPAYHATVNSVSGQVTDQQNQPMPGVSVMVPETTIGAATDMNGKYSLTLPSNTGHLNFAFIGYKSQTVPVTGPVIHVVLEEDVLALQEVVVMGYGEQEDNEVSAALQGRVSGISVRGGTSRSRTPESIAVPFKQTANQTTVDFEITSPYTVKSDNKSYSVDMAVYQVPAYYQYYAVPKVSTDAFLIAHITGWEQYNLLEGEANLFFEDTFTGKTLIDARYATDTLQISLGKDKNIGISRENLKDFTTRQFIGSKKEEARSWKTTVRNNKSQEVNILVLDQVPVSRLEEVEVDASDLSGGKLNKLTGEVKWEFKLKPMERKELNLKYAVKYPKSRSLVVE